MRCENVQLELDELARGELEPRTAAAVRKHLASCSPCSDWLDEVETLARRAPRLRGESPVSFSSLVLDHYGPLEVAGARFWVAWSARGVRTITPGGEDELLARYERLWDRPLERGELPADHREQIACALAGEGAARPRVDLSLLRPFERGVLRTLREIPVGEVRTYAWVAREVGSPRAVRAVGNACARNPVPFLMPCHRVVPTGGGIGRYAFGPELKETLLSREGVDLPQLERLARRKVRYVGSRRGAFYCFPTCTDARALPAEDRVPLHDDREARADGFEPCDRCRPLAYQAA